MRPFIWIMVNPCWTVSGIQSTLITTDGNTGLAAEGFEGENAFTMD